jgi:L-2-amino-thiazoline-4-carboxylic acid hydrolase
MPDRDAAPAPSRLAVMLIRRGKPFARVAADRAIVGRNRSRTDPTAGRFTHREVARFVNDAFDRFEGQVPGLPREPTVGSRQNVMLAALTLSLLEILEESGVERSYAIELTGDTCWRLYRHWGRATKKVAGLVSRAPTNRLRLSVNAFLTYPFGRPGYRFDDVPEEDGRSLNMVRCPVADYLGQRGAADLCAGSWCNLDYALAAMWEARLQRSGTLVGGANCCDFRFHALPPTGKRAEQPLANPLPTIIQQYSASPAPLP